MFKFYKNNFSIKHVLKAKVYNTSCRAYSVNAALAMNFYRIFWSWQELFRSRLAGARNLVLGKPKAFQVYLELYEETSEKNSTKH